MDSLPLVSIVCLCYNQKAYIRQAIESVYTQTYKNIQLIIVDDASTDGSPEVIKESIQEAPPHIQPLFISIPINRGNCAAFNLGLKEVLGAYVIDLAGDDILLPKRVEEGVNALENAPSLVGVHYSDAFLIDKVGQVIGTHYERDTDGHLRSEPPSGNVYLQLITQYFICPPTMMMRTGVMRALGGYDEKLSYEDFDFWIRSSRKYHYLFHPAPLVKKRLLAGSHSQSQFALRNHHQKSTLEVCKKIHQLNKTAKEAKALKQRCVYEIKQCLKTLNLELLPEYWRLMRPLKSQND